MMNPNAGRKIPLPPRAARAQPQPPAQPPPSAAASKVISSIEERVKNVDLRPPARKPGPESAAPRRRAQDSEVPFSMKKLKGIWFEPSVLSALNLMQKRNESVSQFVNNAVKEKLGL